MLLFFFCFCKVLLLMDVVACKSDMQFLLLLQNLIVIAPNDRELFVGVVHTNMLQTSYYSFEMLLPSSLSCARML